MASGASHSLIEEAPGGHWRGLQARPCSFALLIIRSVYLSRLFPTRLVFGCGQTSPHLPICCLQGRAACSPCSAPHPTAPYTPMLSGGRLKWRHCVLTCLMLAGEGTMQPLLSPSPPLDGWAPSSPPPHARAPGSAKAAGASRLRTATVPGESWFHAWFLHGSCMGLATPGWLAPLGCEVLSWQVTVFAWSCMGLAWDLLRAGRWAS